MMNSQIARKNDYTTTHQKHIKIKLTNVPFLLVNLVGECNILFRQLKFKST